MKYALVLGATSDIAKALAHQYGSVGYHLILASRNCERLEPVKKDLQIRHNIEVELVEFDALDTESHPAFYQNLSHAPELIICAFGYLGDQKKAESDFAEAEMILHTNYTGAVSILNVVANDFEQRKTGAIIVIGSVAGDRGRQSNYFYGSAKAGLHAYVSGLRNRLVKSKVKVITIKPGFTYTRMTEGIDMPPALTAQPEEVAKDIYNGHRKNKDVIYTKWFWRFIMGIIILIPERIFKKLNL